LNLVSLVDQNKIKIETVGDIYF